MSKQIRLDDDVYKDLAHRLLPREKFSDAVKRLVAVDDSTIVTHDIHEGKSKNDETPAQQ